MALSDTVLSTVVTVVLTVLSGLLSILVLRSYLSFTRTSKVVIALTALGYFLGFFLLVLMPLDVGATSYLSCLNSTNASDPLTNTSKCQRPFNFVEPEILKALWSFIYWTSFVCTWVVYPFMTSYVFSGEFRFFGKVKASFKENVIFYGVGLVVGVVVFVIIFLMVKAEKAYGDTDTIMLILHGAKTTGNLFGLAMLICLLGYGFIFVPRSYWRMGDRNLVLQHAQSKLAQYYDDVDVNASTLNMTLKLLRKYDLEMEKQHENRIYLNEILQEHTPPEYSSIKNGEGEINFDYSSLVDLNAKVQWDTKQYTTARVLFDETYKEAVAVDDILKALNSGWKRKFSFRDTGRIGFWAPLKEYIDHIWVVCAPFVYRTLSIFFAFMSASFLYSEVVIIFQNWKSLPNLSFYGFLAEKAQTSPLGLEVFTFLLVGYLAFCTYAALFKVELFYFYKLLPHQQTDEGSILFSAAYLSRLIAPLALNFLYVINFANDETKLVTSPFILVMSPGTGSNNKDPIQQKAFIIFPVVLIVICIFTMFSLCNKIMGLFGLNKVCCTDDFNDEDIDRGRDIMNREREAKARYSTTARRIVLRESKFAQPINEEAELESIIVTLDPDKEPDASPSWSMQNSVQKAFDFLGSIKLPSFATPINRFSYSHDHDDDDVELAPDSPPESPRRKRTYSIDGDVPLSSDLHSALDLPPSKLAVSTNPFGPSPSSPRTSTPAPQPKVSSTNPFASTNATAAKPVASTNPFAESAPKVKYAWDSDTD